MKHLIASLFIISIIHPSSVQSQNQGNPLIGTWRLISSTGNMKNGSWNNDSSVIHQTKIVTPSRFVFTTYSPKNDSLLMSAEGTVTVNKNMYSETIERSTR